MSNQDEAAFPMYGVTSAVQQGMSLRDYFAAGFANVVYVSTSTMITHPTNGMEHFHKPVNDVAKLAYELADAMLAERSK